MQRALEKFGAIGVLALCIGTIALLIGKSKQPGQIPVANNREMNIIKEHEGTQ